MADKAKTRGDKPTADEPVVVKKYANRRLYNTATSSYVTLDDLSGMVKEGVDFVVYDAKSGDDITRSVLTQIIFEQESRGQNLLPIQFLRRLIRFYGDSMQAVLPSYLDLSLETFSKQREEMRERFSDAWGGQKAIEAFEEQARQNMALFEQTMRMFSPFANPGMTPGGVPGAPGSTSSATPPAAPKAEAAGGERENLDEIKKQMDALQKRLDDMVTARTKK